MMNKLKILSNILVDYSINVKKNEKVLIVNETKDNIENYIGPNTFAEISCAFYFNKKIYLLNDYYVPYIDELVGWGTINLKGNLDKIDEK